MVKATQGFFETSSGLDVEIGCATGNLADMSALPRKAGSLLRGREALRQFSERTGYAGFEVHPTRDRFLAETLGVAAVRRIIGHSIPYDMDVMSTHMSFTSPDSSLVERLVLPTSVESMHTLRRVERAVGGPRDMVVYPERLPPEGRFTDENSTCARRGVQQTAEYWAEHGLIHEHPHAVRAFLGKIGVTHLVPDTFHYRRNAKDAADAYLRPWEEVLPIDAADDAIMEVHLALGRIDMAGPGSAVDASIVATSMRELAAALRSPEAFRRTEAWAMIETVAENIPRTKTEPGRLRVVSEVPRAAIAKIGLPFDEAHAQLVHSVAENLRAA